MIIFSIFSLLYSFNFKQILRFVDGMGNHRVVIIIKMYVDEIELFFWVMNEERIFTCKSTAKKHNSKFKSQIKCLRETKKLKQYVRTQEFNLNFRQRSASKLSIWVEYVYTSASKLSSWREQITYKRWSPTFAAIYDDKMVRSGTKRCHLN